MKPHVILYALPEDPASTRYVGAYGRLRTEWGMRASFRTVIAVKKSLLLLAKHITRLPTITIEVDGRERARVDTARPYPLVHTALTTLFL